MIVTMEVKTMSRSRFKPMFIGIVCLLLAICSVSSAQETSLFSGRVVDEAGEPVVDITVALMPVEDGRGAWFPVPTAADTPWSDEPRAFSAVTDAEGNFSITDFGSGPVFFGLLPFYHPPADILHLEMNGFIVYASGFARGRGIVASGAARDQGIVFVIASGNQGENVEVTVRRALQIQGRVHGMDEEPLANADIQLRLQLLSLEDGDKSSMSWSAHTDADGEFVQWMSRWPTSAPVYYIVSATYQGHRAQAKPVLLNPDTLSFTSVLRFPTPLPPPLPGNASHQPHASASVSSGMAPHGVWVINPGNGHAYKKIRCSGPEDAIFQASEAGAYLVSINDAAEQQWLERVFSPRMTLIGLNDIAQEGEWRWHSGEPVTYTNWAPHEPHDTDKGEEDYVMWRGGWEDIGPEQIPWRLLRTALIEKEGKR